MAATTKLKRPYEGTEPFFFVSYSHQDSERVYSVLSEMEKRGYRFWYDDGIEPGMEWPESIAEHLSASYACVAFISKTSLESMNCRREINFALSRNKNFLSVILEPVEMTPGMEMQISTYQSLLLHKFGQEETVRRLCMVEMLKACRGEVPEEHPEAGAGTPEAGTKKPEGRTPKPESENGLAGQTSAALWVKDDFAGGKPEKPAKPGKTVEPEKAVEPGKSPEPEKTETTEKAGKKSRGDKQRKTSRSGNPSGKPGKGRKSLLKGVIAAVVLAALGVGGYSFLQASAGFTLNDKTYRDNATTVSINGGELTPDMVKKLSRFTHCKTLKINSCTLPEGTIQALAKMKNLEMLEITDSPVSDSLEPFSGSEKLYSLVLRSCGVTDEQVESFTGARRINRLEISGGSLTKVPQMPESAENLRTLNLADNELTDLAGIEQYAGVTTLNVSGCALTDLAGVEAMERLAELRAADNELTDIEPVGYLVYLTMLDVSGNRIESLAPLESVTLLTALSDGGNEDLADLQMIKKSGATLENLNLSGLQNVEISLVSSCPKLEVLDLHGSRLMHDGTSTEDLSFLAGQRALRWLNVQDCGLTSFGSIEKLTALEFVNAQDNQLTSTEGLSMRKDTRNLLLLDRNRLESLSGLEDENLWLLTLEDNENLTDYSVLAKTPVFGLLLEVSENTDLRSLSCSENRKYYVTDVDLKVKVDFEKAISPRSVYYVTAEDVIRSEAGSKMEYSLDL